MYDERLSIIMSEFFVSDGRIIYSAKKKNKAGDGENVWNKRSTYLLLADGTFWGRHHQTIAVDQSWLHLHISIRSMGTMSNGTVTNTPWKKRSQLTLTHTRDPTLVWVWSKYDVCNVYGLLSRPHSHKHGPRWLNISRVAELIQRMQWKVLQVFHLMD